MTDTLTPVPVRRRRGGTAAVQQPRDIEPRGIDVWELLVRPLGSLSEFQVFPSEKHPYRFVQLADAEKTIMSLQCGTGLRNAMLYEVLPRRRFLPFVMALAEIYCELCNVQTGNYASDRPERRLVSACRDCSYKDPE